MPLSLGGDDSACPRGDDDRSQGPDPARKVLRKRGIHRPEAWHRRCLSGHRLHPTGFLMIPPAMRRASRAALLLAAAASPLAAQARVTLTPFASSNRSLPDAPNVYGLGIT